MSHSPSPQLVVHLRESLMRSPPFAQMSALQVDRFVTASTQTYHAPGETVLSPADGPVGHLYLVRQGHVSGRRDGDEASAAFEIDAGELFPVGAVMAGRAVTSTYRAQADTFCLLLPRAEALTLAAESPAFADYLNARMQRLLDLSRAALQAAHASHTLSEQSFETPLAQLLHGAPATVPPETPLRQALLLMHERRIGSVLVGDGVGPPLGILTRNEILGRVTLPQLPLSTPIAQVMTSPVHTLDSSATAHDAALLMSRHGFRHVPVTTHGRLVGIVSERDLFARQRLSIKQVSAALRGGADLAALQAAAEQVRRLAGSLHGQGVAARQLTELISHLNDVLTVRLVELTAARHGLELDRACWLAFGSEGRGEQTVATDQDNGLVFDSASPEADRPVWLAFARDVNEALAACGYPLCRGNVMASNPACCLGVDEWCERFEHWIAHGSPEDLLNASIYFDLRPLAGNATLARPLREHIAQRAAQVPRFIKQMADNALRSAPPLDWLGGIATHEVDGRSVLDLKFHGTALFVDAARLYALAQGVPEVNTRRRFEAVGGTLKASAREREGWIGAFEFLQMLRLRTQLQPAGGSLPPAQANLIEPSSLNDVDRRTLKECLGIARRLQQRMTLDYRR